VLDETIVPIDEFPPATPFTSQVTAVLVDEVVVVLFRLTVAVKSVCAPGATVADDGVIETELTVTAPDPPQPETPARIMTRKK
jgi:hypothetical protein